MELNNLLSAIKIIVFEGWEASAIPVPLSKIGAVLPETAKNELEASSLSLHKVISTYLAAEIRQILSTKYGGLACPQESTQSLSDDALIRKFEARKKVNNAPTASKKFKPEIWKAFITPLGSEARYIIISDDGFIRISTDKTEAGESASAYEVLEEDLAFNPDQTRVSFYEARKRIDNWIDRNGISRELMYAPLTDAHPYNGLLHRHEVTDARMSSGVNKLLELFRALSEEELRRIAIPADVVYKLIRDQR